MIKTNIIFAVIVSICIFIAVTPLQADEIKLKNETVFTGKIVYEDNKRLILENPDYGFLGFSKSEIGIISRKEFPEPGKEKGIVVITLHTGKKYKGTVVDANEEIISIEIPETGRKTLMRSKIKNILTERDKELPVTISRTHGRFALLVIQLDEKSISLAEFKKQLVKLSSPVVSSLLRYLSMKPKTALINLSVEVILQFKNETTINHLVYLMAVTTTEVQLAIINALGKIGDSNAVEALVQIMLGDNKQLGSLAERAVRTILQKNPEDSNLINVLHNAAKSAEPIGKIRILNCLGFSRSRLAAGALLEFLGEWEKNTVKRTALTALGKLGFRESSICKAIRPFLKHKDDQVRKEAALALGRLQDFESGKELIELLKDKNRGVRKNTYWALRNITGLKFPLHYDRWKIWWDNELKELKAKRGKYLIELRSGEMKKKINAIKALARLKLGKKEIAEALLEYIDLGDTETRVEICKALGQIKEQVALPHLVKCLEDYEQKVKDAACEALRAVTGKDFPPEKDKWEKWFRSRE
jgi:HEAT repeat protein